MPDPATTARVHAHDGTRLATDVYLPSTGSQTRWPALLLRTPYGKQGEIDRVAQLAPSLTSAGVAVVVQDVRGKFDSEGSTVPFVHEIADGDATCQWIADQRWSNGAVVPFGDSYAGLTSWAAAASGHPAVLAAIVRVTSSHIAEEWMNRQGAFRLQQNAQWAVFAWSTREIVDLEPDWDTRPLASLEAITDGTSPLASWLETEPSSPRWRTEILGHDPPLSQHVAVPVLHWGGWWDLMARGQVREWSHLVGAAATPQRLVMSATDHSFNPFTCVYGAAAATSFEHHYREVAEFIAAAASGSLAAQQPPVRWELTHDGWYEDVTWPPPDTEPRRLYLADGSSACYGPEGGALSAVPDSIATTIGIPHDPGDLVPSLETFLWGTLANDYPDERDVHVRPDVMTFSGAAADGPVDLAGPTSLRLSVDVPRGGAQLTATLSDVHPDGRALRIAEGAAELAGGGDLNAGSVELDLGPLAYRLRAGHRLRLALAASAFPRYLWHTTDRSTVWHSTGGTPHEISVRLGHESFLQALYLRRRS